MIRKEVAKFFSGFAANQVLTHGALAAPAFNSRSCRRVQRARQRLAPFES